MLPLQDINPTYRRPYLTWTLIAVNVLVFMYELTLDQRGLALLFANDAVVPYQFTNHFDLDAVLDILRSMFFHGGWSHLIGNMLYLYIFGDNVEDRFGKIVYALFYLVCGAAAAITQVLIDPQSLVPMVGASGAIAGVLGAYALLFPGVRVRGLVFLGYFSRVAEVPALLVLGFWFVLQLFSGLLSLGVETGVAVFAHIGGFVAGMALAGLFMKIIPQPPTATRRQWVHDRHYQRW
jgi:membrane associated rhomboid family serine protease